MKFCVNIMLDMSDEIDKFFTVSFTIVDQNKSMLLVDSYMTGMIAFIAT